MMTINFNKWKFWIDRGGTFTDVVGCSPDGQLSTQKLLSESPDQYEDAALEGMRRLLNISPSADLKASEIDHIKMGTTVATNALLERQGEPVVLVTTKGFADALRIGYQTRSDLFALNIQLPDVLNSCVVEAKERISAKGDVLVSLDETVLRHDLEKIYAQGIRSAAIVFVHGYRYHDHEKKAQNIALDIGFTQVSASHEVSPLIKFVARGDTTVVDAYLSPVLSRYVEHIQKQAPDIRLLFMQSNGGLTDACLFQGKDSVLSGPAGGVVGMAKTASQSGFDKVIGFDMGGTSTDVSHFNGEYERAFETQVGGVRLRAQMMHIHTVAAGGGSILHFDGGRFRVGPDSAGANPGPACYRRGGPLTITDCNVLLGKVQPDHFPKVFGPNADQCLDQQVVWDKFQDLAAEIERVAQTTLSPTQIAEGFLAVAVENMANAIKEISVQRGYDITQYTLNCFGGAAGQHVAQVADSLGINTILVHPFSGVLSAYGMGLADFLIIRERAIECPLNMNEHAKCSHAFVDLEKKASDELVAQGLEPESITAKQKMHIRYAGTDTSLAIDYSTLSEIRTRFEHQHRQRFGFVQSNKTLILEKISVEALGIERSSVKPLFDNKTQKPPLQEYQRISMTSEGKLQEAPLYNISDMSVQDCVNGPAILQDANATIVVEQGWQATYTDLGNVVLKRHKPRPKRSSVGTDADPIMLEIFNNIFMSIAEQMGAVLANTSHSVNIKERLDFSCAIFDDKGQLVANAPHMPVHLGSMGESVMSVMQAYLKAIRPGDVFAVNAPYNGGTHLPDVTLITPVFAEVGKEILFYVASRGHHADIGGMTPGSMPPHSTSVEQEGILFDNIRIVAGDIFDEKGVRALLSSGSWPARNIEQNIADLKAQIAANEKGVGELNGLIDHFGIDVVQAYMQHVQDNAEENVRKALCSVHEGDFAYEMDNGAVIKVSITIDLEAREATVDFTGTSPQQDNNFNAPTAVCRAAVLYVFRTIVADEIPLNAGCLKPIKMIIPKGSMLNPCYPAAVVAGNVETSQCITDALYGALGIMAAAQGTMNNFTFGNDHYQYYETICGGAGAGFDFNGQSAVQTHMTNSRLTDPEILELRFPVLLESFSIRTNSGGQGKHRGGDGVIRCLKFLEPLEATILSNHRKIAPFGLCGGQDGKCGANKIKRANGTLETLKSTAKVTMNSGDVFVIETPGGGGFG